MPIFELAAEAVSLKVGGLVLDVKHVVTFLCGIQSLILVLVTPVFDFCCISLSFI